MGQLKKPRAVGSLAPLVVEMLEEQLALLKAGGLTTVVTYVLENGTVWYEGPMPEFLGNEDVRRMSSRK